MNAYILLSLTAVTFLCQEAIGAKWDYHGPRGPAHWPMIKGSVCGGQRQSPVNILTRKTIPADLGEFVFEGLVYAHAPHPGAPNGRGNNGGGNGWNGAGNGWNGAGGNGGNGAGGNAGTGGGGGWNGGAPWGGQGNGGNGWSNGWGNGGPWWNMAGNGNGNQQWSNPFGNLRMPDKNQGAVQPTPFGWRGPTDVMTPNNNDIPNARRTPVQFRTAPTRPVTVSNDGHTLKVGLENFYTLHGGSLPNSFKPAQLHFHWGTTHNQGSEHTVDHMSYAAELHLVHFNTQYRTIGEAMKQPNGLAVLGFFIEAVDIDNPAFDTLLEITDNVRFKGAEVTYNAPLPLREMLPYDLTNFWRYNGSLTVPMCWESVIWTVFTEPIRLSHSQLDMFRELYQGLVVEPNGQLELLNIEENFRPTQPLFGRQIIKSGNGPNRPFMGRSTNNSSVLLPANFLMLLSAAMLIIARSL